MLNIPSASKLLSKVFDKTPNFIHIVKQEWVFLPGSVIDEKLKEVLYHQI